MNQRALGEELSETTSLRRAAGPESNVSKSKRWLFMLCKAVNNLVSVHSHGLELTVRQDMMMMMMTMSISVAHVSTDWNA